MDQRARIRLDLLAWNDVLWTSSLNTQAQSLCFREGKRTRWVALGTAPGLIRVHRESDDVSLRRREELGERQCGFASVGFV